jgi:3-hydroxyisobutyrate dehydrogenase
MSAEEKVGYIGLGVMGASMAANLIKSGRPVHVFNRTASKMKPLVAMSAVAESSPAAVARQCGVVFINVSDSPDVEQVVTGPNGVLEGLQTGAIVVDNSTISPAVTEQLGRQVAEKGGQWVDAPVSGGDIGARNGTLSIMVGGDADAFEKILPLLKVLGKTINHMGPVGAGQKTKLCNQVLVCGNLLAACEALSLGEKVGLDPKQLIQAIGAGAAGSWQFSNLGPRMVDQDNAPGFAINLLQKDLRLVAEASEQAGQATWCADRVRNLNEKFSPEDQAKFGTQALKLIVEKLTPAD